jgi:hypothetical protein
MDLQTARSELLDIIGADYSPSEADAKLNEGHKELCVRAEWLRGTLSIGNTVAGQQLYALPTNVYRPLRVKVNGTRYEASDEDTVDDFVSGAMTLVVNGVWFLQGDANGTDQFALYPVPTQGGLPITARCVLVPPTLENDTDEFVPPSDTHQAVIYFAAARSLGGSEDDLDSRSYYMDQFDGIVGRLKRLRKSRTGSGPVNMRIAGITA